MQQNLLSPAIRQTTPTEPQARHPGAHRHCLRLKLEFPSALHHSVKNVAHAVNRLTENEYRLDLAQRAQRRWVVRKELEQPPVYQQV